MFFFFFILHILLGNALNLTICIRLVLVRWTWKMHMLISIWHFQDHTYCKATCCISTPVLIYWGRFLQKMRLYHHVKEPIYILYHVNKPLTFHAQDSFPFYCLSYITGWIQNFCKTPSFLSWHQTKSTDKQILSTKYRYFRVRLM